MMMCDVYQEMWRSVTWDLGRSSPPPPPFHINPVNMRTSIWKTPNCRDAFHSLSSECEQISFSCTWVRIRTVACFFSLFHRLMSVDFLLLLIWSHPWRDTDWFMADVCSLMKSNHAIGLLSQLFVRLFWCCVLSCSHCDVVWPVQVPSSYNM